MKILTFSLFLLLGLFGQNLAQSDERNKTYFELISSNGWNLNGSIKNEIYNATTTATTKITRRNESASAKPENTTQNQNMTGDIKFQNGTAVNRTEKAFAIFSPDFWQNLLGMFSGNVKIGIHGDLSNVASGNLESRGSVGLSVNGQDMSVGAKFGIGGNLGQGISNTGSIGAGGKVVAKPSFHFTKPKLSLASMPLMGNAQMKEANGKNGNGNWKNIKEYFKVFIDRPK